MAGRVLALALVLTIATGCTGSGSGTVTSPRNGAPAPSPEQLQSMLESEFDRLGVDPAKVIAAAPTGNTNAVFDLTAQVIDPDGDGPQDPTGVKLEWTERLIGDYDQNGMVTQGDLTPIGQFWDQTINYDDPSLHDGLAYWPTGDPVGGGAANWRLAQVDGNDNGLIEGADITSIAQHWLERISGYRVYRKAPGESTFTWIENPTDGTSKYTLERPSASAGGPVRISFTDSPAVSGEYEYYVVGFATETSSSSMEGQTPSNTVNAALAFTGIDVHPPEWDTAVGVTSATANGDGTVTVEWGSASDIAHPPAVASPPVSYTLYYSTESPINFETAYAVEDATSPWTSVQLVDGTEYYFAVRAKDSADPPNVEGNTEVKSAIVSGGVIDNDPPEWTGVTTHLDDGYTEPLEGGLAAVEVGDGVLTIRCAPAEDILSPPVHYDLYYVSLSGMADYSTRPLQWSSATAEVAPHEDAVVINDITQVYELSWENRHPVSVMVVARDSHDVPNLCEPMYHGFTAPSDAPAVEIDASFPWVESGQLKKISCRSVCDTENSMCYSLYLPNGSLSQYGIHFYLVRQDLLRGTWDAKLIYEHDKAEQPTFMNMALSPNGYIFAQVRFIISLGVGYDEYWRINPENGDFTIWEPGDSLGEWYRSELGHNGLPATIVLRESTLNPDYYEAWYRWYDEETEAWTEELASDPGGQSFLRTRPDGVLQLISYGVKVEDGSDAPSYGQIHERSPQGVWEEIYRFENDQVLNFYEPVFAQAFNSGSKSTPHWGNECDWLVTQLVNDDRSRVLRYSYISGYHDCGDHLIESNAIPFIHETDLHEIYGSVRLSINDDKLDYYCWSSNIERRWSHQPNNGEVPYMRYINTHTGDYSFWYREHDPFTGEIKYFIRSSYYGNTSIYDPLAPDWER